MIRCQQFSSRTPSRSASVHQAASARQMLSLLLMSLLAMGLIVSTAQAQLTTAGGRVRSDDAASRIEFGSYNQEQPAASYDPGAEPVIQEIHEPFIGGGYGTGQCCGDCPPAWRVRAEGLLLNYEGGSGVTLSNGFALDDFGYEQGGRVSVVRHLDCLDAWELSYTGPFEWTEFGQVNGVGLQSRLNSTTVNLSEFDNATFHSQGYRTRLNSVELNRRWYGWDVISTFAGARYINIDEDYLFNSTGAAGTGVLSIQTDNQMGGAQIGTELMYPVGNWMTTTSLKGALMANFAEGNVRLLNAGVVEVANSDDKLRLVPLVELGYYFSYQITPRVKFRGGYEFWWLCGFAEAPRQLTNPITAKTGARLNAGSDVFYHGASAGIEVVW